MKTTKPKDPSKCEHGVSVYMPECCSLCPGDSASGGPMAKAEGKPRYSTLVRWLNIMIGEVECELDACGGDEVMEHPVLRGKWENVKKANKVLKRARGY